MMEQQINLKHLEKKTAAGTFDTGIVEIGIGLILVVSSLAMIFDDIRYYIDILYIVPVLFISLAVKYIAQPRMGVVNFARKRVRNTRLLTITITTFLVIMVTLTFIGKTNIIPESINPRWFINSVIFSICVAVAYFKSFDRMYIYAFLLVGTFNLSEEIRENDWIISEGGYAYLLASLVLLITGTIYLIKFLKRNPVPTKDMVFDK